MLDVDVVSAIILLLQRHKKMLFRSIYTAVVFTYCCCSSNLEYRICYSSCLLTRRKSRLGKTASSLQASMWYVESDM